MARATITILGTEIIKNMIKDTMQITFPDESEDFNKGFKYFGEKVLQAFEKMETEDFDDGMRIDGTCRKPS